MKETAGSAPAADRSLGPGADALCSPHEVSRLTGVAPATIHKWVAQERICSRPAEASRYANAILVSPADVEAEKEWRARCLSARQAGVELGVAETTVVYYCRRGYLPFKRRGKLYEIDVDELGRFAEWRAGRPDLWDGQKGLTRDVVGADERVCALEGCTRTVLVWPARAKGGRMQFCSQAHYALELKRRCRTGELVLSLMAASVRSRRRWGGIVGGQKGGRPRGYTDQQAERVRELRRLFPSRGIRAIARMAGVSKWQVEAIVAAHKVSGNPSARLS